MDVKEAVAVARSYLTDIYTGEAIENLGLEEVEFDDSADAWCITLGFSRPWDRSPQPRPSVLPLTLGEPAPQQELRRSYKVLRINDGDGSVESLKDRFGPDGLN